MDAGAWGIDAGYHDVTGAWREPPAETVPALLAAMDPPEGADAPPLPRQPTWIVHPGEAHHLHGVCTVTLEDGTALAAADRLPPDLPLGYHGLRPAGPGPTTRLVVSPGRCHLPPDLRTWGWAVQLYAARSRASWGIGDLADLREIGRWTRELGGEVLVVNPLHAAAPVTPQEPSPYFPTSRVFRNPLYLRVEEVDGARGLEGIDDLAARGRALNGDRRIDRDAVLELKLDALARIWSRFGGDPRFDAYVDEWGDALTGFATYCMLTEEHGANWREWPVGLQRPDGPDVAREFARHENRVRFHLWLQWLLDEQLAAAGEAAVVQDLAIGFDPAGADAWTWQDWIAHGVRVGAPPDEFNTRGQDWGLPPFVPWKLRDRGYDPFIQTMRGALRHAGGLRVDHVMGLFRLFWIPEGAGPAAGTYVRYPSNDLLDLLALESHRAGAFVVGEDLGTVEDEVRRELADREVLSYRLVWFEPNPPEEFPEQALAAVTTHDLPTVAGLWTGSDLEAQREIGTEPNEESTRELHQKLQRLLDVDEDAPVPEVVERTYRRLGRAPSMVVCGTLDDALCVEERPNMPGTTDEWPNWSIALPAPLEDIERDPHALAVATALDEGRRGAG